MPESEIIMQMIVLVLVLFVPLVIGLVFLLLALAKRSWRETRPFIFIGAASGFALGIGLIVMRALVYVFEEAPPEDVFRTPPASPIDAVRILPLALVGAFLGGLVALVWGKLKRKPRPEIP